MKYEEELKKRIELLEKKHKKHIFHSHAKNNIEADIKKDFSMDSGDINEDEDVSSKISSKKLYVSSLTPPKETKKSKIDYKKYSDDGADDALNSSIKKSSQLVTKIKDEIGKVIVGQEKVVDGLIRGLICNGHVLLEGVPGIAKTLVIRALGQVTGCSVKRVQFTVDLLPTDITGITSYTPGKGFEVVKGPIFANFLIADEINRSPPKTQSALLEAMQEKQVTIGKTSFVLPDPFFVMATKNPLENTGVYQLPEAQVDRFLFNIIMTYPSLDEERKIMEDNITLRKFDDFKLNAVISPKDILHMQELVKKIYIGDHVKSYILSIVEKTRDKNFKFADCISFGSSPRASIALFIASKARALMSGRSFVLPEDVKEVCFDVLRHRIILSYKATIRGLNSEDIIKEILDEVHV